MQLSVIISYYKALDNLKLILLALENQSNLDFEVIISEDDYNINTIDFIDNYKSSCSFPILHTNQKEDKGFRKNQMLNQSIVLAHSERLAFIDGDCIPHHHFAHEYIKAIRPGENKYYSGRAVMLNESFSASITNDEIIKLMYQTYLLFRHADKWKDGIYFPYFPLSFRAKGLVGRNWGIWKKCLLDINGFDEDYTYAGIGEDTDIEWRLKANGNKLESMKNKAIVYHIYHKKSYSEEKVKENIEMMNEKVNLGHVLCKNGIKKI